ncbi:MAG TPA: hypothetical protein VF100_14235, partial [Thermoanaerobaculia bacterium]
MPGARSSHHGPPPRRQGRTGTRLDAPTTALPGVGPARARALAAAGFATLGDLLFHVPIRYEDRSTVMPVAAAAAGESGTFRGRLRDLRPVR